MSTALTIEDRRHVYNIPPRKQSTQVNNDIVPMDLGNMHPNNNNNKHKSNRPSTSNRNNNNYRGNNNNNSRNSNNRNRKNNTNDNRNRDANNKGKRTQYPRPCRFCRGPHWDRDCTVQFNALPSAVETSTAVKQGN